MRRIAFIIPYYGRFNDYFRLWLKSCEWNADVADFWIISDIPYNEYRPDNVKFIPMSWTDLVAHIQSFYDFKIALQSPYKLCDYKCAYGEIFNSFLVGYSHWAYGDNDLIWGRWSNFIPSDWSTYDKLGEFGHLTIIKNSDEMNKLYRYNDVYKIVFTDSRNLFFDEKGFNRIVKVCGKRTYTFKIADCNPRIKKLTPVTPLEDTQSGLFKWENGNLIHLYEKDGMVVSEDVMYIHFLKRKMSVIEKTHWTSLLIYDLIIECIDGSQKLSYIPKKFLRNHFYLEYWYKYLSISQIKKTILSRIYPISSKVEEIEQRISNIIEK